MPSTNQKQDFFLHPERAIALRIRRRVCVAKVPVRIAPSKSIDETNAHWNVSGLVIEGNSSM
jgi:hypothetical protein